MEPHEITTAPTIPPDESNTTLANLYSRIQELRLFLRVPVDERTPEGVAQALATLQVVDLLETLNNYALDVSSLSARGLANMLLAGEPRPFEPACEKPLIY